MRVCVCVSGITAHQKPEQIVKEREKITKIFTKKYRRELHLGKIDFVTNSYKNIFILLKLQYKFNQLHIRHCLNLT